MPEQPLPEQPFDAPGSRDGRVPSGAVAWPSIAYSAPDGYRPLELDLYVPDGAGPVPCVVWIHGGSGMRGTRLGVPGGWPPASVFQACADAGLAVASIDYRLAREAPFPAQLHDAKAAVRYLRRFAGELGIDPDRIGVWGESAGALLAFLLALSANEPALEGEDGVTDQSGAVSPVVGFYGIADIGTLPDPLASLAPDVVEQLKNAPGGLPANPIELLLTGSPLGEQAMPLISPVHHVTPDAPPFLLIHGTDDHTVPFSQSEELRDALATNGVPVELVAVAGADHVFLGADPLPQIDRAVAFLAARLLG